MVTSFSYYPEWRKRKEDRGCWFRREEVNGVRIHRCWHYVPSRPSTLRRILHELSFVATTFLRVLTLRKAEVTVVVSPPLLLGFAAWLTGVFTRTPFVFHVQDMQPDAAFKMGMVQGGPFMRLLYFLEAFSYRKAARVSGISEGMLRAFKSKGVPPEKLILFPNGVILPNVAELPPAGGFRRRMGIAPDAFLAVYSGNLGVKHGIEILLETARLLQGRNLRIVICGDGARRPLLAEQIKSQGLDNVSLIPLQPEAGYLEMMVDADLYLVTQQAGSGSLFFPSKLLKGLALAKAVAVVADAESELARSASEGRFAVTVAPDRPADLAAELEKLAMDPVRLRALGEAGRKYVEQFELNRLLTGFETDLRLLVAQPRLKLKPTPEVDTVSH
jgi:colanic acid biosynthesis glycosyl transferase WcaI